MKSRNSDEFPYWVDSHCETTTLVYPALKQLELCGLSKQVDELVDVIVIVVRMGADT